MLENGYKHGRAHFLRQRSLAVLLKSQGLSSPQFTGQGKSRVIANFGRREGFSSFFFHRILLISTSQKRFGEYSKQVDKATGLH
jgi:hypothetical protein